MVFCIKALQKKMFFLKENKLLYDGTTRLTTSKYKQTVLELALLELDQGILAQYTMDGQIII